jgi:hypothetical protein
MSPGMGGGLTSTNEMIANHSKHVTLEEELFAFSDRNDAITESMW